MYWHVYNFTVEEPLPDLYVSKVNCDWESKRISFTVKNGGQGSVTEDFAITLYVNGEESKETMCTHDLDANEECNSFFDASDILYGNEVDITIFADSHNDVVEENEDNNRYSITCAPEVDTTPPLFTAGPTVIDVTLNSATITWETDELSNGKVSYGENFGKNSSSASG